MTPTEIYAQKREEAVELIRTHAPERLQGALIELLRPAIALLATRTDDTQIPIGASKFGGAPDVPEDFVWPTWDEKPLGFLAQINLEEVAAFDVEELLPKSGLLSFFYEVDEPEFTDISTEGSGKVLFFPDVAVCRTPIERETEMQTATIVLEANWRWPYHFAAKTQENRASFANFDYEFGLRNPCHLIFGYGIPIVGDPAEAAAERSTQIKRETPEYFEKRDQSDHNSQNWVLLLQLDSDEVLNTMWGDVGTLYFLIQRDDLKALRFDKVWMELQFT